MIHKANRPNVSKVVPAHHCGCSFPTRPTLADGGVQLNGVPQDGYQLPMIITGQVPPWFMNPGTYSNHCLPAL